VKVNVLESLGHLPSLLVKMTPFSFKSEFRYYQQQSLSGTSDQEDFVAMQQSRYQAQFLLEDCDTPPPSNHLVSYNPSNSAMMGGVDSARRGNAFARDVLRPYHSSMSPSYTSNGTGRFLDRGGAGSLKKKKKIENFQQQIDDPFTSSGLSVVSSTSSLDSDTTIRNSTEHTSSTNDEDEMIHDTWSDDNITLNTRPQQFQGPVYHFVEAKPALVTDASPDNYFTSHFMHHGDQFVFTHTKRPSQSDPAKTPSPKKHCTIAGQAVGNFRNGSPRKSKRKIRAEQRNTIIDEEIGNLTGRELARKFREDTSRWWKIVVNPTGRWD
jgi:hypothetical protein